MRLLKKAPEQRYQTHYGLTYDLTESLAEGGGSLGSGHSRIGDRDLLAAFSVPDTFRGREEEQALILDAANLASFRAAETSRGSAALQGSANPA